MSSEGTSPTATPSHPAAPANRLALAALVPLAGLLAWRGEPALALVTGLAFALVTRARLPRRVASLQKWLLQACVVLLGFGMSLPVVLRAGLHGALFAAASIAATLALGMWLGRRFALPGRTPLLLSAGTAICGGSAIAAVSSVVGATEAEIAVSIGTVFLLNALALVGFPPLGHALHLSPDAFGLWAGIAIHDISSVVGAGIAYGGGALQTATAVKLSRTLWIAPLTFGIAWLRRRRAGDAAGGRARLAVPWFIGLFLLASLLRSAVPAVADAAPRVALVARGGMAVVLLLIGASLSPAALRTVGWRAVAAGALLWIAISAGSLAAIAAGVAAH